MSSTRRIMAMCTVWYSYLPPAKARPARHRKTSSSLLGAEMRLSRCVWFECTFDPLEHGEDIRSGSACPTDWSSSPPSSALTVPFSPSSRKRIYYMRVARTDMYAFGTCRSRRSFVRSSFKRRAPCSLSFICRCAYLRT